MRAKDVLIRNVTTPVVAGYRRACVYDLQRAEYRFAPNDLARFATAAEGKTPVEASGLFPGSEEVTSTYLDLLLSAEYMLSVDSEAAMQFMPLRLEYATPSVLTNCILDLSPKTDAGQIEKLVIHLRNARCYTLQIRWPDGVGLDHMKEIVALFEGTHIDNLQLVISSKYGILIGSLQELISYHQRVVAVYVCDAPENAWLAEVNPVRSVLLRTDPMDNFEVQQHRMVVNTKLFTEAHSRHAYFNQKMHIDRGGAIGAAPGVEQRFGDLDDVGPKEMLAIIGDPAFQRCWHVTKDKTDVCSSCEFRYMCIDSRHPLERLGDQWFHAAECNYNPYICKWKGEEGYRTLVECGVVSNAKGFSIDHDRIAAINAELWGE